MSLFTTIRWQQRLINLRKAFSLLTQAVSQNEYNELEKAGLIQQFEFCFELSWKTLKDYLQNEGVSVDTPRDVIKQAFSINLLSDVNIWIDALEKRNLMSHAYEKETALLVISLIKEKYFLAVKHLVEFFNTKTFSSSYGLDLSVLLQLLQQLTKYVGIEEVILFGSRAMGNFKSTSDIDLCLKGTLTENDLGEIKTLFEEGKVPYKVDVILYDSIKDPAILEHIKCFGKKIYP